MNLSLQTSTMDKVYRVKKDVCYKSFSATCIEEVSEALNIIYTATGVKFTPRELIEMVDLQAVIKGQLQE